ncbi:hypothetical protein PL79_013405 [Burkholderia sp. USMB20]|nr:hypothetical protein PL79_013405 [Burkholderia sp. USMB20]
MSVARAGGGRECAAMRSGLARAARKKAGRMGGRLRGRSACSRRGLGLAACGLRLAACGLRPAAELTCGRRSRGRTCRRRRSGSSAHSPSCRKPARR